MTTDVHKSKKNKKTNNPQPFQCNDCYVYGEAKLDTGLAVLFAQQTAHITFDEQELTEELLKLSAD